MENIKHNPDDSYEESKKTTKQIAKNLWLRPNKSTIIGNALNNQIMINDKNIKKIYKLSKQFKNSKKSTKKNFQKFLEDQKFNKNALEVLKLEPTNTSLTNNKMLVKRLKEKLEKLLK